MHKRQFLLATVAGSALVPALSFARGTDRPVGPTLLTLSGAIRNVNRGTIIDFGAPGAMLSA